MSDQNTMSEPHAAARGRLANLFRHSTVGVALYDSTLHCLALNCALAAMDIVCLDQHIGKSVHQVFGTAAEDLEPLFRRVLATGNSLSNFALSVRLPKSRETRRWFVNFYPIKDESCRVRLVAVTFFEITKRSCVELRLSHLTNKLREDGCSENRLLGEDLAELLDRSLKQAWRSVELLNSSCSLRSYVSEIRMEAVLMPLKLFLTVSKHPDFASDSTPTVENSPINVSGLSDAADKGEPPPSDPSARERQVLHLLANGKSNKEIGAALEISTRTVETYRARVMFKLKLHSTADLVRYAIRNNIVEA
jgi:DNA-binding CsgD family transcriptional regulator